MARGSWGWCPGAVEDVRLAVPPSAGVDEVRHENAACVVASLFFCLGGGDTTSESHGPVLGDPTLKSAFGIVVQFAEVEI